VAEAIGDASLSTWLGIGLVALGAWLLFGRFVPGVSLVGSIGILAAGIVLLVLHLRRGFGAWALYVGAVLTGVGAARVIADLTPLPSQGLTAVGVGGAFLAIGYLRHTQAGGWGWQGILGGAVLAIGVVQWLLGWLPGAPGITDVLLPLLLLAGGGWLLYRRAEARSAGPGR
jgi:hypothetical protein